MRFSLGGEPMGRVKQLATPQDIGPRRRGRCRRRADAELLPEQPPHAAADRQPAVDAAGAADDAVDAWSTTACRRRPRAASAELVAVGARHRRRDRRRAVPVDDGARAVGRPSVRWRVAAARRRPRARHRRPAVGAAQQPRVPGQPLRRGTCDGPTTDRPAADPARRCCKWGGVALASTWVDGLVWPLDVRAQGRGDAARHRAQLHLHRAGRRHQPDGLLGLQGDALDAEGPRRHRGRARASTCRGRCSRSSSKHMDQVALVRSLQAPELIHFNGQYHTQTGRSLNPAVAREIPAFGSVIAYELGAEAPRERRLPHLRQHQPDQGPRRLDRLRVPADVVHRPRPRSRARCSRRSAAT